jgi:hypothetical protein
VVAVARKAVFPAGVDSIVVMCINAFRKRCLCGFGACERWWTVALEVVDRRCEVPYGRRMDWIELMMRAQT